MAISITRPVVWTTTSAGKPPTVGDDVACCPNYPEGYPVKFLIVDYRVEGGARITWKMDPSFEATGPLSIKLQGSQSGVPDAEDWIDIGYPSTDPAFLVDDVKRMYGVSDTLHYRIVIVDSVNTYISKPSKVATGTLGSISDYLTVQEIYRKEKLRFTIQVGVQGYLLKEKRYGVLCNCVNPVTREQMNSSCLSCYGRNYVDGFHVPLRCAYGDLSTEEAREFVDYEGNKATVKDVIIVARMLAEVPIVQSDVWVSAQFDKRYYVHKVVNLVEFKGVPIVYGVQLRLAPKSDIIYKIELDDEEIEPINCDWGKSDLQEVETICVPT